MSDQVAAFFVAFVLLVAPALCIAAMLVLAGYRKMRGLPVHDRDTSCICQDCKHLGWGAYTHHT